MELGKLAYETVKAPVTFAKFVGKQLLGGAWGDLGSTYGEEVGGHNVHPASIQFYTTGETEPEVKAA